MENELLSQNKMAAALGCTRKALRRAVTKHGIPHKVLEHTTRRDQMFNVQEVQDFLTRHPHIWELDLDPQRSSRKRKFDYAAPPRTLINWVAANPKWKRRRAARPALNKFLQFAGGNPRNWTLAWVLEWEKHLFSDGSGVNHTTACDYVTNVQRILEEVRQTELWEELTNQEASTPSPAPASPPPPLPVPLSKPDPAVRIRKPGKPSRPTVEAISQAEADRIAEDLLDELFIFFGEGKTFCWTDVHRAVVDGDVGLSVALEDAGLPSGLVDWGARFNNYLKLVQSKQFDSGLGLEADLQHGLYRAHRPMTWKIVRVGTKNESFAQPSDPRDADLFDFINKTHSVIVLAGCELSTQQLNMVRSLLASMSMTVDKLYEAARHREGR